MTEVFRVYPTSKSTGYKIAMSKGNKFKRVAPISVPENWEEEGFYLNKKIQTETFEKTSHLSIDEADRLLSVGMPPFDVKDVLLYFETSLSVKEVYDAAKFQTEFRAIEEEITTPHFLAMGQIRLDFKSWWIVTRMDVNTVTMSKLEVKYYLACADAYRVFFLDNDIQAAYRHIRSTDD